MQNLVGRITLNKSMRKMIAKREFLLKNFQMILKKQSDISEKYIIPNETAKFAVMYVPSQGVLMQLVITSLIFQKRLKKRM